jgi:hypothetical protein
MTPRITATYPTFEAAERRVATLRQSGVWPGILGPYPDGGYRLTYDPDTRDDT